MAALVMSLRFSSLNRLKVFRTVFDGSQMKLISTSGKKKDTPMVTDHPPTPRKRYGLYDESCEPPKPEAKDWISYGFSNVSEAEDRFSMKIIGFGGISLMLVGGAFILAYIPDLKGLDWTKREAYLELHRREKLGLPRIDRNLVDPSKINLPTEEELGDMEIII